MMRMLTRLFCRTAFTSGGVNGYGRARFVAYHARYEHGHPLQVLRHQEAPSPAGRTRRSRAHATHVAFAPTRWQTRSGPDAAGPSSPAPASATVRNAKHSMAPSASPRPTCCRARRSCLRSTTRRSVRTKASIRNPFLHGGVPAQSADKHRLPPRFERLSTHRLSCCAATRASASLRASTTVRQAKKWSVITRR
jgi:hypothetical protein